MELEPTQDQIDWFDEQLDSWTTELEVLTPSAWTEANRYLPQSVTNHPGYFRFDLTPYMREPLDCLSVDSPVRELAIMKGVQLAFTVALLENAVGYGIAHVKTAPMMFVTAEADMATQRMGSNILPMLQHSKLEHLIKSSDEGNNRKSGQTRTKLEFSGGGFLLMAGARNPNKGRSTSVRFLYCDEVDGWPEKTVDGDIAEVFRDRTTGFEDSRKIVWGSTPRLKGTSKIERYYERGDQRKYFVCCLECGHAQELKWRRENPDTGEVTGIDWDTDEQGRLKPGSARYLCEECGHAHTNDDKTRLLSPDHGAEWRPTAVPESPTHRSYHISALYSPFQSWDECVLKWLKAWDVENNKPRDYDALQVFYNNVLGVPYKVQGDRIRFEQVSPHRRHWYTGGNVPNRAAVEHGGGPILGILLSVDIQKDWMALGTWGFTRGRRLFLIERWNLGNDPYSKTQNQGDCDQLDDPHTWQQLQKIMLERRYVADDGSRYPIALTLIDSGYKKDHVYRFCSRFSAGVVAVKGRTETEKSNLQHFQRIKTSENILAYGVAVDSYKDRIAAALKHEWDGFGMMPEGQISLPADVRDQYLKELTVEVKRELVSAAGKHIGWEWHRPNGARNETLDLGVYAMAGVDLLAFHTFPPNEKAGVFQVNWGQFFDACEGANGRPLFFEKQ